MGAEPWGQSRGTSPSGRPLWCQVPSTNFKRPLNTGRLVLPGAEAARVEEIAVVQIPAVSKHLGWREWAEPELLTCSVRGNRWGAAGGGLGGQRGDREKRTHQGGGGGLVMGTDFT